MTRVPRLAQAFVAVLVFVIVGCSRAPSTALTGPGAGLTTDVATPGPANAPAAATETGMVAPEVLSDTAMARAVTLSGVIDGLKGGRLENEHVRLDIPGGAFIGTGLITVTFPDPLLFVVDLDIQPAALNRFARPVELRLKCAGMQKGASTPAAWWWNPGDSLWYGLKDSQYDSGGDEVRVKLSHFSTYAAGGKAGW